MVNQDGILQDTSIGSGIMGNSKHQLSERDICTKFITPAIKRAGWDIQGQVREEYPLTAGRISVKTNTLEVA